MESYQTIIMAECVAKERQERAQSAADQWHLNDRDVPHTGLREVTAGALINLAQWIAPQHAALGVQHR